MKKNIVLIINPVSEKIMKAIYNVIVTNLIEVILIGDTKTIYQLCKQININVELLQIVDLLTISDISSKIEEYMQINEIKGIIIDDIPSGNLIKNIKFNYICNLIDYGIFVQSVFVVNYKNNNIIDNINQTIEIIKQLNINRINIGIVLGDKTKTIELKSIIKNNLNVKKVDIINIKKINKCKYNIILFEDKILEKQYLNNIKNKVLSRSIKICKKSNVFIFDAKIESFNTLFLQILFLSKIDKNLNKVYSKII